MVELTSLRFFDEPGDRCDIEMIDDLRQIELRSKSLVGNEAGLLHGVRIRVRPPAKRQPRLAHPDVAAQLPRMLHATRAASGPVAAEHHQRRKSMLPRLLCVAETEIQRVLARQERHDTLVRNVTPQIVHEMSEIVLFLSANRTVGEKDRGV